MNSREQSVIRFLLQHELVHSNQIAETTGMSMRTVANYLDRIEAEIKPFGVQLVRKPRVGISLVGNSAEKAKLLSALDGQTGFASRAARERYLLIKLLLTNRYYTLNELADDLFVSRSTIENDFRNVKNLLTDENVDIQTSSDGVAVNADRDERQRLLAKILHTYWGESLAVAQAANGSSIPSIKLPTYLHDFFPEDVTQAVMAGLSDFMDATDLRLTDYEIQSLAIHLIMNGRETVNLQSAGAPQTLLPETKQLLTKVSQHLGRDFGNAQQERVNMHVAAIVERERNAVTKVPITLAAAGIRAFLLQHLGEMRPDELLLHDLTVHLSAAITRLRQGITISNPYTDEIKRNLPVAFDYAVSLGSALQQRYGVKLTEDELGFLALHLEAFFERGHAQQRIDTVVVCATGVGTSHLLAQRLEERYRSQLHITRVLDLASLVHADIRENLIISTIPISGLDQPVIVVSPLLQSTDVTNINLQIARLNDNQHAHTMLDLLHPGLLKVATGHHSYQDILPGMVNQLIDTGVLVDEPQLAKIAIKREEWATTALNLVAIPHVPPEYVSRPAIAVTVLPDGAQWCGQTVYVVLFLAMTKDADKRTRNMYAIINNLIDNPSFCLQLARAGNAETVYQELKNFIEKEAGTNDPIY
jgi:transcriptional antiterminator/mannitol/fructose-specific phosphotransferase system IIA component (Ntr-type)